MSPIILQSYRTKNLKVQGLSLDELAIAGNFKPLEIQETSLEKELKISLLVNDVSYELDKTTQVSGDYLGKIGALTMVYLELK